MAIDKDQLLIATSDNAKLANTLLSMALEHLSAEQLQAFLDDVQSKNVVTNKATIKESENGYVVLYSGVSADYLQKGESVFGNIEDAHADAKETQSQTGCVIEWLCTKPNLSA